MNCTSEVALDVNVKASFWVCWDELPETPTSAPRYKAARIMDGWKSEDVDGSDRCSSVLSEDSTMDMDGWSG